MPLLSFEEALALEPQQRRRHVLLGNGFSIACRPEIFRYSALFDRADFAELGHEVHGLFDALETRDFEGVMRALRLAAIALRVYGHEDEELPRRLQADSVALREVLVNAIADSHPEHPFQIADEEYQSARVFLSNFTRYYSLSYDLLLYWTAMQDLEPTLTFDDGFRTPDTGPAEYVTWEVEKTDSQVAHYLHGALHIFDAGHEIQKFTWLNTRIRLIEQIRDALNSDLFPLIVSEGASEDKLAKIHHSTYLSRGYRSIAKIGGALFTFGVAFSDNDSHILDLIKKNRRLGTLAVGVYGDEDKEDNVRLLRKIRELNDHRPDTAQLEIAFYDAESARVWVQPNVS